MKITSKYKRTLDVYLEWEHVRTPASGSFQESRMSAPQISVADGGMSAEQALCVWESTGKPCKVSPDHAEMLSRLLRGKAQRDWWSKEIGWWNKHAVYMPEEFLVFLGPMPFIELFGRAPVTRIVRHLYDNRYKRWEFHLDGAMQAKVRQWNMPYFEREDRDSALQNAWRMVLVKYISPMLYRLKRRYLQGVQ